MSVISSKGEDKKVIVGGVKKLLKEKNTIKGASKNRASRVELLDDEDGPIESIYFSPGNKKNK